MIEWIKKFIRDNLTGIDNRTYYIAKSSLAGCIITTIIVGLHQEFFGHGLDLTIFASSLGIIIASHGGVIGLTPHTEPKE